MKRVYIAVINDLATDQRVHRVAGLLAGERVDTTCIGRRLTHSPEPQAFPFKIHRFSLLFNRGPLFYASYNLLLCLKLLTVRKPDLVISNDLDTLPACFLASRIRRVPLIYDSHELFTRTPELIGRKRVQRFWLWIESLLVPRVRFALTVNQSLATMYRRLYGTPFRVVRNMPERLDIGPEDNDPGKGGEPPMIIYQGALNVGRGIESVIDAVFYLEGVRFVIAGTGDIEQDLKARVRNRGMEDRVEFTGRLLPGDLTDLTRKADLGISLEEDRGLNYRYALPNKLFDYIQCRVPVLCSALPEMERIIDSYGVGIATGERDPEKLAEIIRYMLKEGSSGSWKEALEQAAGDLCWEKESVIYREMLEECGVIAGP